MISPTCNTPSPAQPARLLFVQFLNWLEPQLPTSFAHSKRAALEVLSSPERAGDFYQLEPYETYQLSGFTLHEMVSHTQFYQSFAIDLVTEVQRLASTPGATLLSSKYPSITNIKADWEGNLGLYFPKYP